jgi:hypothetical protein
MSAARHGKLSSARIFTIRRKNDFVAISRLPDCCTKTTATTWQDECLEMFTIWIGQTHHNHRDLIVRGASDARITKFFAHVLYGSLYKAVNIIKN